MLVAAKEVEVPGVVADGAYGERGASGRIFVARGIGLVTHFVRDGGGFESPDAVLTPEAGSHLDDEPFFGGVTGLEIGVERIEKRVEAFATLAFKEQDVGENSMIRGITG